MDKTFIAYNELAWVDTVLYSPEDIREETETYCKIIDDHTTQKPRTMLHLGCGAGFNDFIFKEHYEIVGIDISEGMLDIARQKNPEVSYLKDDMRTACLNTLFDVVAIPESIGYMATLDDLNKTIQNAYDHLKPGGLLFIVAQTKDTFKENNFAYSGQKGAVQVTVFENNCIVRDDSYEATIIYLIREKGKLATYQEVHTIGLFSQAIWKQLLGEVGFSVQVMDADDTYDQYLLDDGEYPQHIILGKK